MMILIVVILFLLSDRFAEPAAVQPAREFVPMLRRHLRAHVSQLYTVCLCSNAVVPFARRLIASGGGELVFRSPSHVVALISSLSAHTPSARCRLDRRHSAVLVEKC